MNCGCGSTYTLTPGDRLYLSAMVRSLQQRVSALEGGGVGSDLDIFITQKLQAILPSWTLQPLPPAETDPTIPLWAKQSTKPSYTAAEVGATTPEYVNQIATIVANNAASALNSHAARVDNPHNVTAAQLGAAAIADLATVAFSGDYNDLLNAYQTVVEYSDTAPADAGVKFWFKTDTGILYTRYGSVWASIDTVTV